jgi:putative aldouronate transport system permease protein
MVRSPGMRTRLGSAELVFQVFNYCALAVLAILSIYPFWNLVAQSVSGVSPLKLHQVYLWPLEPQLDAFKSIFSGGLFWKSFKLTGLITVLGVLVSVPLTALLAYPLSKREFRWRKPLTLLVVITMFFSGGLIPEYLLYRYLGLLNTIWVYLIPGAISTWSLLILRNFFQQIPESLEESARIDGAGDLTVLVRIVLPMSMPILATITLWYAVGKWNTFSQCMYFTSSMELRTLQVDLRSIVLGENVRQGYAFISREYRGMSTQSINAASIVVTTLPILLVYPFLQRFFVKGIILGSLKG